jgi:hypothetical protein
MLPVTAARPPHQPTTTTTTTTSTSPSSSLSTFFLFLFFVTSPPSWKPQTPSFAPFDSFLPPPHLSLNGH